MLFAFIISNKAWDNLLFTMFIRVVVVMIAIRLSVCYMKNSLWQLLKTRRHKLNNTVICSISFSKFSFYCFLFERHLGLCPAFRHSWEWVSFLFCFIVAPSMVLGRLSLAWFTSVENSILFGDFTTIVF